VSQPRNPLRLNVGFIIGQPIGSSRDFHFDYPSVHLQPDLDLNSFIGIARIGRTPQGLVVQAKFQADQKMECVRCLEEFDQRLEIEFNDLYAFSRRTASESGLILPESGIIDLEPLVREYMLIEIPISPLCKPDCKGLCPVCGENLNETTCEHQRGRMEQQMSSS
jgi:uncharacterized protein